MESQQEDIQDDDINIDEFFTNLNDYIRKKENFELIQANLYTCLSVFCIVFVSFLQAEGEKGWSSKILDSKGNQAFSPETQELLEQNFKKATWLLPVLKGSLYEEQYGGGLLLETVEDTSLDEMFEAFTKKIKEQEIFWSSFSKVDPGISTWVSGDTENIRKPILTLLLTLLDMLRMSASLTGQETFTYSLLQWINGLVTGEWRKTTVHFSYYLSPSGTAATILFKYLLHAWMVIHPLLRNQIVKDMYRGTKAVVIGFLIWCITNIPSDSIRQPIDKAIDRLRLLLQDKSIEVETFKRKAAEAGIELPELTAESLSKNLTINDFHSIQILARSPKVLCSTEFQSILLPLKADPMFRLLLELSDIPMLDTEKYEICGLPTNSILKEETQQTKEEQHGGKRKRRFTIRQKRHIKHQTRRL